MESSVIEKSGMLTEDIHSEIRRTTQAHLEGFETVDVWSDEQQHWIHYRLSKSVYAKQKQKNLGRSSWQKIYLIEETKVYLQAFIPIQEYLANTLEIVYGQRKVYLQNFLYQKILSLVSDFSITSKKLQSSLKFGQSVSKNLNFTVKYKDSEPLPSLPFKCFFTKGNGNVVPIVLTNQSGQGKCVLSRINTMEKIQIIEVKLDLKSLAGDGELTSVYFQNFISNIPVSTT